MITAGDGRYKVWLKKQRSGDDLVYVLGGGERSHIGGVALKVPGEELKILRIGNHYDHHVLGPIAEAAEKKYNRTVVVVGGIHIDNATKEEIRILVANVEELMKEL